jgi:hypothetical protein
MKVKKEAYEQCQKFVNERLQTIEKTIRSSKKALASETKSSAGDKHETGRAMLQLEMEKAGQQLQTISLLKETLSKIDFSKNSEIAHLGSIIITAKRNYFLSISAGQLVIENNVYFAISTSSPIGKLLLGKQMNETVFFNGETIKIIEIF